MKGRLSGLALLVALVASPLAAAHGGEGYESVIRKIAPKVAGFRVQVLDGDEKLRINNGTGKPVIVLGYSGEPYLRYNAGGGIDANIRSPAYYVNQDRYAKTPVPPIANSKAKPKWKRVGSGKTYAWHDHRIHWMSTIPPPAVKADPDKPHKVFDWKVPVRVGTSLASIDGTLSYDPALKK